MAPSPTAEATRFMESSRTSPAAKTPGHAGLEGERRHGSGAMRPAATVSSSGPVTTKPLSSRSTSSPSQSVRGERPDEDEEPVAWRPPPRCPTPRSASVSASRWLSPSAPTTWVPQPHLDVLGGQDPGDEVLRHRGLERVPPHDEHHLLGVASEVEGRLAGRVGRPDDVDVLARRTARPRWRSRRSRRRGLASASSPPPRAGGRTPRSRPARRGPRSRPRRRAVRRAPAPAVSKPTTSRASTISAPNATPGRPRGA